MSGFKTRKKFGQHFLKDQGVLRQICQYCSLSPDDYCVEIGPGEGALTNYLLKTGAHIHAIEIDLRLKPTLEKFAQDHDVFSFTIGDVLAIDLRDVLAQDDVTVIGNLPYEISTPLLFTLIGVRSHLKQMVFLLQKEVVERITASVGTRAYGRLSVMMQYYFSVSALMRVKPEAFSPPPKVISQVVMLKPIEREWVDHDALSNFVKYIFAHKRKMLRQRFKTFLQPVDWDNLGIESSNRPGNLTLDDMLRMLTYLQSKGHFLS